MGRPVIDLSGQHFGRYSVIKFDMVSRSGAVWLCRCTCGQERLVAANDLRRGNTNSCGCLRSEMVAERMRTHGATSRTHGATGTRLFNIWRGMLERCRLTSHKSYAQYGGRGITVCERWQERFEYFLMDMGQPPSAKHTLDRWPNNEGNYEPGNCRWATMFEQSRNRRTNVTYAFHGETLVLKDLAVVSGIPETTLYKRLKDGLSVEDATRKGYRERRRLAT